MKLYIGFLLFFLTSINGMCCFKWFSCMNFSSKKIRTDWIEPDQNIVRFSLYESANINPLIVLNATLLSYEDELIGEIRIDSIQGEAFFNDDFAHELSYVLEEFIKRAREKEFKSIVYHNFSGHDVHSSFHSELLRNDFTKKLIRSKLGNKNLSDMQAEHYFYEKEL